MHVENLADTLPGMSRAELIEVLRSLDCGFKLDFTPEFLAEIPLERLRHLVLAAAAQTGHAAFGTSNRPARAS